MMKQRDPTPGESNKYKAPSVLTDPTVAMVFTDPETKFSILEKESAWQRSLKLLENGMLLEVESPLIVPYDLESKSGYDLSFMTPADVERNRQLVPDLVYYNTLSSFPGFARDELGHYIRGFTDRARRLLKFDKNKDEFVRDNFQRVTDYLVEKLDLGHLRFYIKPGCDPDFHMSIVFGDFARPQEPKLLYLVYGLQPLVWVPYKGPHIYIPWEPCLESSEENPAKRIKH